MRDVSELAKIMNTQTRIIQFCETREAANNYCKNNRDWIMVF